MDFTTTDPLGLLGGIDSVAIETDKQVLSRRALHARVLEFANFLRETEASCIALQADNGIDWIVADLACYQADICIVPVPHFFSETQVRHALRSSGAEFLLTDNRGPEVSGCDPVSWHRPPGSLKLFRLPPARSAGTPGKTRKITYTSGTSGDPKGVCLSAARQFAVARELAAMTGLTSPRHMCLLPLSTLLENLAGVYAPLIAGGTIVVLPLDSIGIEGSSGLRPGQLLATISARQPHTLILVPELLRALVAAAEAGWEPPPSLRFVAVGGGKVGAGLLNRARAAGIPAFEGYGLSECGSVVSLNVPGADRAGAAGLPLPHLDVRVDQGEIIVKGAVHLGYVGDPQSWGLTEVHTGDLGLIDPDGFVHVQGRCGNRIISSYGRNLSPEWVESALLGNTLLHQAVVFGDARPWCVALLHPSNPATSDRDIADWVHQVNRGLPDYARVIDWIRLPGPLTAGSGLMTDNGRPRRTAIENHYREDLEKLYDIESEAIGQ